MSAGGREGWPARESARESIEVLRESIEVLRVSEKMQDRDRER